MRIKNKLSLGLIILLSSLLCACDSEGGGTALTLSATPTPTIAPTPTQKPVAPTPTQKPAENLEPPMVKKWEYQAPSANRPVQPLQFSPDKQTGFLVVSDSVKSAEVVALDLASGKVKWQADISALIYDRADNLRIFSVLDNNMLYLTSMRSLGGLVIALDAASGAQKWEFKLDPALGFLGGNIESQGDNLFVTFETPDALEVLLDKVRTSYLVAIDKKSGTKNWEFKTDNTEVVQRLKASATGTYLSTSPQLLYLRPVDGVIYGIDPASGKVSWKLGQPNNLRLVSAYKDGVLLIVVDPLDFTKWTLRAVATKDGSTLWNLPLTSQKDEGAGQGYFFSDENTLYLISARFDLQGGTLHRIDLTKGTLKWSYNDPRISQTPGSKDSPFLKANQERVYGFGVVKPGLLALDAETGKPAWQVDNTNYYGLAATKDTLYSSDGKKLLAFAVASGTQSWSIDLPPNSHLTYWMQNTGNLLLLLQSNGVLAYGRA